MPWRPRPRRIPDIARMVANPRPALSAATAGGIVNPLGARSATALAFVTPEATRERVECRAPGVRRCDE